MDIIQLRKDILGSFKDHYLLNDLAHRENHFEEVFQCAVKIDEVLGLGFDPKLMLLAAYFHDLFAWSRNNHHALSHQWVMSSDHPILIDNLNMGERELVAWACGQHRASFAGKFRHTFSELINSADRGFPGDVESMVQRAMRYRESKHPDMSDVECREYSIAHIKSKFGKDGYALYPQMYLDCFGEELEAQYKEIQLL